RRAARADGPRGDGPHDLRQCLGDVGRTACREGAQHPVREGGLEADPLSMNLIARYHEIALKGRNRPFFVEKLADNLRRALSDLPGVSVHPFSSRIAVQIPDETPWETVRERVERVFG